MCNLTRRSGDPLLRRFLDIYGLHLLRCPRAGIEVGALVLVRRTRSAILDHLGDLLDGPVSLVGVRNGEPMAEVQGILSSALDLEAGVGISEGFLQALGAVGIGAKLRAAASTAEAAGLHFRFAEPTRDTINPASLGAALARRRFNEAHPAYDPKASYFAVTSVARSKSIDIRLAKEKGRGGEVDIDLEGLVEAKSSVTTEQLDGMTCRFAGETPVVFGVELFELSLDVEHRRMRLALPDQPVAVRAEPEREMEFTPSIIGGDEGSPFLDLAGL